MKAKHLLLQLQKLTHNQSPRFTIFPIQSRQFTSNNNNIKSPVSKSTAVKQPKSIKEQLLKKLDKQLNQKASKDLKPPKELFSDVDANTQYLKQLVEQYKFDEDNEYIKLIEKMQEFKLKQEQENDPRARNELTTEEMIQIVEDLAKEHTDNKIGKPKGIVFKSPPRNLDESVQTLKEADDRYERSKQYLYGYSSRREADSKVARESQSNRIKEQGRYNPLSNTPQGISLQGLIYPPSNCEIILVGLKRRAIIHSSYIYDLLLEAKPEAIFVQLPPDLPCFIRAPNSKDYKGEWIDLLQKGKDASFFVNPRPQYTSDVVLNQNKLKKLFIECLEPAQNDFEIGTNSLYTRGKTLFDDELSADAFFTPLLYAFNSMNQNIQVVMGDKPFIIQRDYAGKAMRLKQASEMFDMTMTQWREEGNLGFNPEYHVQDILIKPRVDYMIEILRQTAHANRSVVAVVDHDLMPYIEEAWKNMRKELRPLESFYKDPETFVKNPQTPQQMLNQDSFLEFVEKQVIMDTILETFVYENFIQYKSFPFDPTPFMGRETAAYNVFTYWKHYKEKYMKIVESTKVLEEDYKKYIKDEGRKL
eukprot:403342056